MRRPKLGRALVLGVIPWLLAPTTAALAAAPVPPSPTIAAAAADTFSVWHGVVRAGGAYVRSAPDGSAPILQQLDPGTPIRIDRWVAGSMMYPDVITWGEVDPADGGGFIFGGTIAGVLPPDAPPIPPSMQGAAGTWLDANLTLNVLTAYQNGQPVKLMLLSPGRPGDQTDTGAFPVRTKLASQEMTGPGYDVPAVPDVQYFSGAEALHGRYWTLPDVGASTNIGVAFGVPSSHGCLGLQVDDAAWLYRFTSVGTTVVVHY